MNNLWLSPMHLFFHVRQPRAPDQAMQRRFIDLNAEQVAALLEADTMPLFGRSQGFDWCELLKSQRITIISEAGSGKTYECQTQQKRMFTDGAPAFFLELSELARVENVASLLYPEHRNRFDHWAQSSDLVATFFLDAYDELKLTQRKFRTALVNLRAFIGTHIERVRLVVTSRPVPFERELVAQLFPVAVPQSKRKTFVDDVMGTGSTDTELTRQKKAAPISRTVCLVPLDEIAIREFVTENGFQEVDGFLLDLHRRDAMDFARRPQDLIELCQDWQDHRKIRLHRDQVETNVVIKLKPREDRAEPAPLSMSKAREGAGDLALAALLTKRLTLRHSFGVGEEGEGEPALDPTRILITWTKEERQTLLERPLFSSASYGRVRFHHRSVLEYLAAERLANLTKAGMTKRALMRLLFAKTPQGIEVVRPSLRPVAAWLSIGDTDIFTETLRREPETLISVGDPESFTFAQRVAVLNTFVERYRTGTWRGLHVSSVQTQRFADPSLGPPAKALWEAGIENSEMREFLLELAAAASLPELADAAVSVFLDASAPDGERIDALKAILRLDDKRLPEIVQCLAKEPERWTNRLLQYAIVELFPKHIGGGDLRTVLAALKPTKSSLDAITWNWPSDIKDIPLSGVEIVDLRRMLHNLLIEDAVWAKESHKLQATRAFLTPALASACLKELNAGTPVQEFEAAAVAAIRFATDREYNDDLPVKSLKLALEDIPSHDRATVFWADDALMQTYRPSTNGWERFYTVWKRAVISIDPEKDRDWVLASLADRGFDLGKRHLALQAALRATRPAESTDVVYLATLRSSVSDSPDLLAVLEQFLAPSEPNLRMEAWAEKDRRNRVKQERKTAKARQSWEDFQSRLIADPAAAFAANKAKHTCWHLWIGMKRGVEFREVGWDRGFIESHFNRDIADRLRHAMMAEWRKINPLLEYERPAAERGTMYYSWSFALAGVYAEAENPTWANSLTTQDAVQAARIATIKLNGLPQWLAPLAAAHSRAVEETLGPDLSAGLDEAKSWSSYLQSLREADPHLRHLFIPRILAWVESYKERKFDDAAKSRVANLLRQALQVLLAHQDRGIDRLLEELATKALADAIDDPLTLTWAQVLLRLNPERGTRELEHLFESTPAPGKEIKEQWVARLFGDRYGSEIPVDLGAEGFSPALLLRLVLLAYSHVRLADDIHHEGTFSPDTRDHAQSGRSALLGALLEREGLDAWQAKLRLAEDPLLAHYRDRALSLAREKCATEADRTAFTEAEVAQLLSRCEIGPKTRDDMFVILSDRLDDIADMLLVDTSPRELWAKADKEYLLRREIARTLDQMANGVYFVNQEAVTADEKETDIRLQSSVSDQQGVIELKRAEGFSGRVLFETISDQLATKYLAPENRRAGLLVISLASKMTFDHPKTGARLKPAVFLGLLEAEAARVEAKLGLEVRIGVRILDLRPRL